MTNKLPLLVLLTGPTAVGKTALSIDLATTFSTEILSCDSRQFYKEMQIGTAVPSKEELHAVKHHFIQHKSVREAYSAGAFEIDAVRCLSKLFENKPVAFLVGGSAMYAKAVYEGLDDIPSIDMAIRKQVDKLYEDKGLAGVQELAKVYDPKLWSEVDQNNPRRLMRTIEMVLQTGKPLSFYQHQAKKTRPFRVLKIGLIREREEIYQRINQRVDLMFEQGLLEEVKALRTLSHLASLQTVGYQEIFDYFDHKIDLESCKQLIKQNTRRFAKRQLTWLRREEGMIRFRPEEKKEINNLIIRTI
ncbi:MAG: tRNA (adenosine(37)-N6)-dimethylallyltransferase MiaA [Flavobacteriales bacterium]